MVHCNFQLRGEESLRDEEFVKGLASKYGVAYYTKRFDTEAYAKENKCSIQEAARELRYNYFDELIKEGKAKYLLTAHHRDDNIETLLMNFLRGTGLHGMTGIPATNKYIRRPLLPFSREGISSFAKDNKLEHVEDSSNISSKYTRNYLRNEWIPAIEKIYPELKENLARNIERFKEIERLYDGSLAGLRKKLLQKKGAEMHVPINLLLRYRNKALVYDIITPYGFTEKQVDELIRLSEADSGKYIDSPSGDYRIIRHRRWFIIAPARSMDLKNIVIEKKDKNILFTNGQLDISTTNPALSEDKSIACLDSGSIAFPLLLRKAKTGDYFYPLGMQKKKKVSRFLIDQKLSKTEKEKTWVLESEGRIIWVVGQRIDDRVKLKPSSQQMLRIRFVSNQNG